MFDFLSVSADLIAFIKTLPDKLKVYDSEKAQMKIDLQNIQKALSDLKTQITTIATTK